MKYLLTLVVVLGFIGCGDDNDEEKVYTKFVYDKSSTQDRISYLFSADQFYREGLISNIGDFNLLIEDLENGGIFYSSEEIRKKIIIHLKNIEINFDNNSLFILFNKIDCRKRQIIISIDNEDNAKIETKIFSSPKTCALITKAINEVYMISKDIQTVNGIDNF